jgi:hypothetical protein
MANARKRARREGMVNMRECGFKGLTRGMSKQTGARSSLSQQFSKND